MKFKRMLAGVLALGMMCAVVPMLPVQEIAVISASAEEYTEGTYENLKYIKYADYVEISGVTDKEITKAVIPAEIDGLPVTSIGEWAFSDCSGLASVTISEGVTSIGSYAFFDCSGLTSVTIPESVIFIGNFAFSETPWLKAKQEENPLVIINTILINGTTCEGDIVIPESVTSIGNSAFSDCSGLTSVTIPESVTSIGNSAFFYCSGLTSVTIPESVTSIGHSAFEYCSQLTSVTIPESVTSIEVTTFRSCENLTSVTIPENVTSIGEWAFFRCSGLTSVIIKNPDCEIYDGESTISNGDDENDNCYFNGTIYGYEDSTAQAYAKKYNRKFEVITSEPKTENFKQGDADGSETVDILDVITINKAIFGKETLTSEQLKAIDFNQNGVPDSEESLMLLKYIVGLLDSLTV